MSKPLWIAIAASFFLAIMKHPPLREWLSAAPRSPTHWRLRFVDNTALLIGLLAFSCSCWGACHAPWTTDEEGLHHMGSQKTETIIPP